MERNVLVIRIHAEFPFQTDLQLASIVNEIKFNEENTIEVALQIRQNGFQ